MKRKIIQEWQVLKTELLFSLILTGAMGVFGVVFLRIISILEPESTYLAFGTLMCLMMLAIYELFAGSRGLVNDFNRAVGLGKPRRDFLLFRLAENYVFLLLVFFALSLWCGMEMRIAAGWFQGGLEVDVRPYLQPAFLPVYALVFMGVKVFFAATMMRNMKITQGIMLGLWCLVLLTPRMLEAVQENENTLFAQGGRLLVAVTGGIPEAAGLLLLGAAGAFLLTAGVLMLKKQQVTA